MSKYEVVKELPELRCIQCNKLDYLVSIQPYDIFGVFNVFCIPPMFKCNGGMTKPLYKITTSFSAN